MDIELAHDFKEFLRLLNSKNVEYLVVGGYAVGYYGYPRATNDLDIWVAINPDNAQQIAAALREFGFDTPELSPDLFLEERNVVRMGVPPVRIEILTTISGVSFADCYPERVIVRIDDVDECVLVNFISLDDLKKNKRAAGRLRDLADLENLEAL